MQGGGADNLHSLEIGNPVFFGSGVGVLAQSFGTWFLQSHK